ncbi:hypothetical protein HOY80DRAFT_619740 [Tuber brumale]|nr:hypothetical protein HOY80DRAFT_619740 [Tuber brumale]
MGSLTQLLYHQQNEHPEGPIQELQQAAAVVMPQAVLQVLSSLTRHIKAVEFALREIDNGAEAVLFSGIPHTLDDECGSTGSRLCPVEVTALRRCQKQIFFGRTIPDVTMVDIALGGCAERFRRQMDIHPPGATAEQIAANRPVIEQQCNHGVNKLMVVLDENGQSFIKGLELSQYPIYMSSLVNSINILSTAHLPPPHFRILLIWKLTISLQYSGFRGAGQG